MSNPTHYSGPELGALLAQVREELGEEATILEANKVRSGGIAGFFTKESFEISASTESIDALDHQVSDEEADDMIHDDMIHDDMISHDFDETMGLEPDEVLEPLDVIGDLAGTPPPKKRISRGQPSNLSTGEQSLAPARITTEQPPPRPELIFNFENLGPAAIPSRLQPIESVSSRDPIPTPSPLRAQLQSSSIPSTTVGERVADALMERAELMNALEHLDKTDDMIAAGLDESANSLVSLREATLDDPSFDQILQQTLSDPYLDEPETLTTAEAVARRIADQDQPGSSTRSIPLDIEGGLAVDIATAGDAGPAAEPASTDLTEPDVDPQVMTVEPMEQQPALTVDPIADAPSPALASRAPIATELTPAEQGPDFWTRMNLAKEEVALYQLAQSNITAIIGPLDLALPLARRCQQQEWIGVEDLAILSSQPSIPGVPSWQAITRVEDLHWAMNEWCASQRRGLVVVDTAERSSNQLLSLITLLRSNGADTIRLAIPAGLEVEDLVALSREIGGQLAVDLPLGVDPESILGALDEGLKIGSIGGHSLSPELLVALRSEVGDGKTTPGGASDTKLTGN